MDGNKIIPFEQRTVFRDFYCGICGAKWTDETDHKSLDEDFHDLFLPSIEKVESSELDEHEDYRILDIHMKRRFRTVCHDCFFAIAKLVELRKDLVNKNRV